MISQQEEEEEEQQQQQQQSHSYDRHVPRGQKYFIYLCFILVEIII